MNAPGPLEAWPCTRHSFIAIGQPSSVGRRKDIKIHPFLITEHLRAREGLLSGADPHSPVLCKPQVAAVRTVVFS